MNLLVIGQDNLFADLVRDGATVDFIQTRTSITPDAPPTQAAPSPADLLKITCRFFSGRYDVALIPAINLDWPHNSGVKQKYLRQLLTLICRSHLFKSLFKLVRPEQTHIVSLDRNDETTCYPTFHEFLDADSYWKTNPLKADVETGVLFHPYWIYPPPSDPPRIAWPDKDIDLFCAVSPNSEARARALQWTEQLKRQAPKLRIFTPSERLDSNGFHAHLARSRLVLSPEGIGYHCFRHYQSMMHGAIPLINRCDAIHTDLAHEVNCLLYDDSKEAFIQTITTAFTQAERLQQASLRAREFALSKHMTATVGRNLLEQIGFNRATPLLSRTD